MLVQDFIPFPSRTQFLGFVRANYLALFPKLIDQRQFNRRARALRLLVEQSRRYGIRRKGWHLGTQYPLDTKPVSLVGYKRNKSHSDFAGSAGYGVRVSRNFKYYGYKRVTVTTLKGIPIIYDLVPVNADERKAAEAVIDPSSSCDFFADKGFLGLQRQTKIFDQTNHLIWTPRRSNQKYQNAKSWDRRLNRFRGRIEGVFHKVQNRAFIGQHDSRIMHSCHHEMDQSSLAAPTAYGFQC